MKCEPALPNEKHMVDFDGMTYKRYWVRKGEDPGVGELFSLRFFVN